MTRKYGVRVDIEPPLGRYRIRIGAEVAEALGTGAPVVALESTIISHGLPRPRNLEVAAEIERTVRATGAVPATVGVIGGEIVVGLDEAQLRHLALTDGIAKASVRDLPVLAAKRLDGATTVASTAAAAAAVGIPVFATGGLGGVHRDASTTFDESADLGTLARTPIAVVCAGVKSILDVPATLERLESSGVTVLGYRTDRFPGFYLSDSGHPVGWRADDPGEIAETLRAARELTLGTGAVVVANPLPVDEQLDPALHDRVLAEGLAGLERNGITGKDVTPYLLAHFHSATEGQSLTVNTRIILRNAELAGLIAVAFAGTRTALA
ncbi:pseudouridine-5'-phosphate glycosidase [Cryptosporangium arvum]|uniref:pseudouridine-5'-phosphate glycosidase n=1 Tax=Cryptosporangium arvum TaxID=80871 RepID=UPI003CCBCFBE